MAQARNVVGMEVVGPGTWDCSACWRGKQMHSTIPHQTEEHSTEVLGCVFSDLCRPMDTPSSEGFCYFITFTDDFSHYTHVGFCKSKDNALNVLKVWQAWAEKETEKSLKIFWTNGGGEYTSKAFNAYLDEHGISWETTNAYTPQENGVAECVNWTINNLAQSMFADAKETLKAKSLPPNLWPQAIWHAVWIKNHIITSSLNS